MPRLDVFVPYGECGAQKGASQEAVLVCSAAFAVWMMKLRGRAVPRPRSFVSGRAMPRPYTFISYRRLRGGSIAPLLLLVRRQSRACISLQRSFCCGEDENDRATSRSRPRRRAGATNRDESNPPPIDPPIFPQSTSIDPPIDPQPPLDRPPTIKTQCREENSLAQ